MLFAFDGPAALPDELRLVRVGTRPVAMPIEALSARECEVLVLIAAGLPYDVAAAALFISERTFRTHAHMINVKLGCRNATQSSVYALAAHIITWAQVEAAWRQHAPHLIEWGS
jgi:DNA-binding CsgD family transcriptional regulator